MTRGLILLRAGMAAVVLGLLVLVLWRVAGPGSSDLGLDPATAAFVRHHDAVDASLADGRDEAAEHAATEGRPEHLMELASAVRAARQQHAAKEPPGFLADVVAQYQQALADEEQALHDAYAALRSEGEARAALLTLLDQRNDAENLQRAIRRTAVAGRAPR